LNIRKTTNTRISSLFVAAIALTVAAPVYSQAPAIEWSLDDAVRQIERQVGDFQTAMARVEVVWTDGDGAEESRTTGTTFIREDGRFRVRFDGGERETLVDRNTVMMYDATASLVKEYSVRSHPDRLEPYARLGFSVTGKDLEDDYLLTIMGEDEIGSSRALVLELTPEREAVRQVVRNIRLYIDQASWMPVRQEISATAGGRTLTMTYSGMARNLKLNPELFQENWPRGTDKERVRN
jgi:outer membrane lipoprotein-sorting protein